MKLYSNNALFKIGKKRKKKKKRCIFGDSVHCPLTWVIGFWVHGPAAWYGYITQPTADDRLWSKSLKVSPMIFKHLRQAPQKLHTLSAISRCCQASLSRQGCPFLNFFLLASCDVHIWLVNGAIAPCNYTSRNWILLFYYSVLIHAFFFIIIIIIICVYQ